MVWRRILLLLLGCVGALAGACGTFGSEDSSPPGDERVDGATPDEAATHDDGSAPDAGPSSRCSTDRPFTEIAIVLGPDGMALGSPASAFAPTLTADESTLVFMMSRPDGGSMLVSSSRSGSGFSAPAPIPSLASNGRDTWPTLAMNVPLLVFESDREAPGTLAPLLLHAAPRLGDGGFGTPYLLEGLAAGASSDSTPFLSADGEELYFSRIASSPDIFRATRLPDGGYGDAKPIDAINTIGGEEYSPVLSADGLTLYFTSDRNFTKVSTIFVARRTSRTDPFQLPVVVAELDDGTVRNPGWLSPDDCRLYFQSVTGDGRYGIYVASRHP